LERKATIALQEICYDGWRSFPNKGLRKTELIIDNNLHLLHVFVPKPIQRNYTNTRDDIMKGTLYLTRVGNKLLTLITMKRRYISSFILYFNWRHDNPSMCNRSTGRFGEKSISNCAGPIISKIKEPWFGINLSDNQLRVLVKRTFYPQSYF